MTFKQASKLMTYCPGDVAKNARTYGEIISDSEGLDKKGWWRLLTIEIEDYFVGIKMINGSYVDILIRQKQNN